MIEMVGWSSFQSYKDRKPPWIRLHRTLIDNFEFQSMSADARALLPMLWLLACEDDDPKAGRISYGYEKISFRLRLGYETVASACKEIEAAGFIVVNQPCNESVTDSLQNSTKPVTPEDRGQRTEAEAEETLCPKNKFSDEDMRFAEWMLGKISALGRKPKANLKSWAETIRLMREQDNLTHRQMAEVFSWANSDDFWQVNILSPSKLRKKFDELSLKAAKAKSQPSRTKSFRERANTDAVNDFLED